MKIYVSIVHDHVQAAILIKKLLKPSLSVVVARMAVDHLYVSSNLAVRKCARDVVWLS